MSFSRRRWRGRWEWRIKSNRKISGGYGIRPYDLSDLSVSSADLRHRRVVRRYSSSTASGPPSPTGEGLRRRRAVKRSSYISILPQANSEAIFLNFIPLAKHKRVRAIKVASALERRKSPIRKFNFTALNSETQCAEGHRGFLKGEWRNDSGFNLSNRSALLPNHQLSPP